MPRIAFLLPLMVVSQLGAAELSIDHVTVAGVKLDQMRRAFSSAVGVAPEYGGPHANHATEMALASFPDGSYIELMGIQATPDPAALVSHPWSKFLKTNAGPCAFALRVSDVGAEVTRLNGLGFKIEPPEKSGRTRPDGFVLSWEGSTLSGALFPFLIHDFTPREKRVNPSGQPTTQRFGGISKVVVGVRDLDAAIDLYRRAYNLPAPLRQIDEGFGAELAWFEGSPIVLAKGLGAASWLAQRVIAYGDAPCAFILAGSGGPMDATPTRWFDRNVVWANDARLGWRLGFESR